MQEVLKNVFVVPANQRKGYGYSHFIVHPNGNILIPRLKTTSLSDSFPDLAGVGGVRMVLITDRHFGGPGCREAASHFEAKLYASDIEAEQIKAKCPVDIELSYEQQNIGGFIEAIPTPGHTSGQFSFLIPVGGKKLLFTGDFIYRSGGKWIPGNRSRKKMSASFERLRTLKFDFIVGCADYDEPVSFVAAGASADALIDEMIASCTGP
jgi:hypothetical protein